MFSMSWLYKCTFGSPKFFFRKTFLTAFRRIQAALCDRRSISMECASHPVNEANEIDGLAKNKQPNKSSFFSNEIELVVLFRDSYPESWLTSATSTFHDSTAF